MEPSGSVRVVVKVTSLALSLQWASSVQLQGVGLDPKACAPLNLVEQILRQFHIDVFNHTGIEAGEMAVGITALAVEPTIGTIQTLDHPGGLQGLQVLIDGRMANAPPSGIELLEDVSGTEVTLFAPEQIEHHPALTAQPHAQLSAALKHPLQPLTGQACS